MDNIGVIGVSWRHTDPDTLARFTLSAEERPARLPLIAERIGAMETFYLATCNRVEVAIVADPCTPIEAFRPRVFAAFTGREPRPGEAERTFHAWQGEGAAEHLALVASGLDSARIGETEILGQVRDAIQLARDLALTGRQLDVVLDEVLKIASRVHKATSVGEGHTSLAEIALEHVRERVRRTPGPIALIGVSPMTTRCARALKDTGTPLVVVNRTLRRAETLAAELGQEACGLEDFLENPRPVEAVVLATASPDPVLPRATLERLIARSPSGAPPLIVDLAVPPDVDPEDAEAVGLPRIGMKEVISEAENNRNQRLVEMADARLLVDEALLGLRRRLVERMIAPLIAALHRRYRKTAQEGVDRLLKKHVKGLDESTTEALRRWVDTLAGRFARLPTLGLRGLAFQQGAEGVRAFLEGLDSGLAAELTEESDTFHGNGRGANGVDQA
jgi:glutamyl-tRNA reductase